MPVHGLKAWILVSMLHVPICTTIAPCNCSCYLQVELTAEQRSLYPELAKLQDDIERLKLTEVQLRNQLFLNDAVSGGDLASAASGQIGYSY